MSISHKALLINGRLISAITQTLPIHQASIHSHITYGIQENAGKNSVNHYLLILAKHLHYLILTLFSLISMILIPWETAHAAPVVTTPVKWHPGHYYTLLGHGKNSDWYLSQVYRELKATPALKGVQIRYDWAELEPSPGNYNFYPIVKRLSELSAINKRLVIVIQMKSFGDGEVVPDYLLASNPYGGGVFKYQSNNTTEIGQNIKLWNPAVYERMAALIRALGNRFNSHAHFEGIGLTETALGDPIDPAITSTQLDTYYDNLLKLQQEMRHSFPNTVTFQFANYPRPLMTSFIPRLVQMGAGLGGPDVFPDEPGLIYSKDPKGVYHYYPPNSGVIPLTPSVMPGNYRNTRVDGTGYEPTPLQLLQFARDELKANYIFWHRLPENKSEVLQMLNWDAQKNRPAGGLQTACPTTFSSCVN